MKTPIQEVYEKFNTLSDSDFKSWMLNTDLLEKEKELLEEIFEDGREDEYQFHINSIERDTFEEYYKRTFNTEEE